MENLLKNKEDLKPVIAIFKTYQSLINFIKEDIKKYNIPLNEFAVFEVIYHYKKIQIQAIKDKILVNNSSLTYILDKLENKKLIRRIKDNNDLRITYVNITKLGEDEALKIFNPHYESLKKLLNILDDEEKNNLIKSLKKISYQGDITWFIYLKKEQLIKH